MLDTRLGRPRAVTGQLMARADRDRAVLMPSKRPVRVGCLVEQNGADRLGGGTEMLGRYPADECVGRQQVEKPDHTMQSDARAILRTPGEYPFDLVQDGKGGAIVSRRPMSHKGQVGPVYRAL